jgi:putative peptidoglycan lipid II flippase
LARQSIKQASIIIAVISISSQGLGLIREALVANYLGTSIEYDILLISMAIPMMLANILFMAIPSAGIPFLQNRFAAERRFGQERSFVKCNSLIILIICATVFLILPLFRNILASGLTESQLDRVIMYGRIFCLIIPLQAYEGVFRALLQLRNNFLFPALTIIGLNLGIITVLLTLFPKLGAPAYIAAWLAGTGIQVIIVLVPSLIMMKSTVNTTSASCKFNSSNYLKYLSVIATIESIGLIIGPFDRLLAGKFLADGYVSANYYAILISSVPIRIFIYALGTAIFPTLSEHIAAGRKMEAGRLYRKAVSMGMTIIIPIAVYLYIFDESTIRLLFQRGRFGADSTRITGEIISYYLMGMVFQALFFIQLKVAFAAKIKRYLLISRVISLALKCVIGYIFIKSDWALAIGGGTLVMFIINFLLLEFHLLTRFGLRYTIEDLKLPIISAGLIVIASFVLNEKSNFNFIVDMVIVGIVAFSSLLFLSMKFGIIRVFSKRKNTQ